MFITEHAAARLAERKITADQVREAVEHGSAWRFDGNTFIRLNNIIAVLRDDELKTTYWV